MTATFKAISKKLLGAKYERAGKSLLVSVFVYVAFSGMGITLIVSQFMFFFLITVFTAGVVLQSLFSEDNAKNLMGLFMLPVSGKDFNIAYSLSIAVFALVTKVLPLLAICLAVFDWTWRHMAVLPFCFVNGVLLATVIFIAIKHRRYIILSTLAVGEALWCLLYGNATYYVVGLFISIAVLSVVLLRTDFYVFYNGGGTAKAAPKIGGSRPSIAVYLLRYLLAHKNYLTNTLAMWAVAWLLPLAFRQIEGMNIMPLGLAILTFNTPLGILLSCNPGLEQMIRALPNQYRMFCIPYGLFVLSSNAIAAVIFLCCCHVCGSIIPGWVYLAAIIIALQSAILTVLLEWHRPIRNWNIESDLWHHPRKYIVPLLMMLITALMSIWPPFLWLWLCVLLMECFTILIKIRSI